jgi:hypothetical protein
MVEDNVITELGRSNPNTDYLAMSICLLSILLSIISLVMSFKTFHSIGNYARKAMDTCLWEALRKMSSDMNPSGLAGRGPIPSVLQEPPIPQEPKKEMPKISIKQG